MLFSEKNNERKKFFSLLEKEVANAEKTGQILNLLLIKLSRLRNINQEFGYDFSDRLLNNVYKKISNVLRKTDHIARVSDKEFALILTDTHGPGDAILFTNQIMALFDNALTLDKQSLKIKLATGIACYPDHADDYLSLMKCADNAVYKACNSLEDYVVYDGSIDADTITMFALEGELEKAINNGDIEYYYQPKVYLNDHTISGLEVLARWHNEKYGNVRPDIFIEAAEKSGLITQLTIDCLGKSLKKYAEVKQKCKFNGTLSVNLSAKILNNQEITERVINTVNIWCDNPEDLVLEITEGAIMTDPETARNTLIKLHETGIKISIDDFGTGYSSLSYLKQLPVDELKVDKSFIMDLLDNKDDILITQSVIDLAHNFGLLAVAEGIESEEIMNELRKMKCDIAQGYYISKPMPPDQLIPWLNDWQTHQAVQKT